MLIPNFKTEREKISSYAYEFIAGCDEAGMGPLAGPVVAAVCILNTEDFWKRRSANDWFARVRDSKTIREVERLQLERGIKRHCLAFGIGQASISEIDRLNIHQARFLAMRRAWNGLLKRFPAYEERFGIILIDGKFKIPDLDIAQQAFVKGDATIISIAAASILAKNYRDRLMRNLHATYPDYDFAQHKGYGTRKHIAALKKFGAIPAHRKSFLKKIIAEK